MSRDVRHEVIEGTMLATLAQLRAAVQRAADASRRAHATEQAATVLLALVADALGAALPGATADAFALVADTTGSRLEVARAEPGVAEALDVLIASTPPAMRDALRATLARAPLDPALDPARELLGPRRELAPSQPHDHESEKPCSTE